MFTKVTGLLVSCVAIQALALPSWAACPDLTGKFTCKSEEALAYEFSQALVGGETAYTVKVTTADGTEGGTVVADGKTLTEVNTVDGQKVTINFTPSCKGEALNILQVATAETPEGAVEQGANINYSLDAGRNLAISGAAWFKMGDQKAEQPFAIACVRQ
jgi:hypothetical protein